MKRILQKVITLCFNKETEFTKKWMAKFTKIVFFLLIFYCFLSQELLIFYHFNIINIKIIIIIFNDYTKFALVLITGYAVSFIGQMGKAFLSKQNEENNKLKREIHKLKQQGKMEE